MTAKLYRLNDLTKRLSVSRSTLYSWIKSGSFPPPKRLGNRLLVWTETDIDEWLQSELSPPTGEQS